MIERRINRTLGHSSLKARSNGIVGILTGLALPVLVNVPVQTFGATTPSNSLQLSWDPSATPGIVGYRVYFGGASRTYTNSVSLGNVTSNTISNLKSGGTYYFATTARDASGQESTYSNEAVYTVPSGGANLQIRAAANGQIILTVNGDSNQTHEILASTNLTTWTVINTLTLGATGSASITDASAPTRPRRFYAARRISP